MVEEKTLIAYLEAARNAEKAEGKEVAEKALRSKNPYMYIIKELKKKLEKNEKEIPQDLSNKSIEDLADLYKEHMNEGEYGKQVEYAFNEKLIQRIEEEAKSTGQWDESYIQNESGKQILNQMMETHFKRILREGK